MTRPLCVFIIRVSCNSFLLYWSWIKTIWSTAEAAGTEATQQEEVTCSMCPAPLSEDFSFLLLWLIWLTLLCSKPNTRTLPDQAVTMPSASLSSSSGLRWPEKLQRFAEESEGAHQLAE